MPEALKQAPEFKKAMEAFQNAKPENLHLALENQQSVAGQKRQIVDAAYMKYIQGEGKEKFNLNQSIQVKELRDSHNTSKQSFIADHAKIYFQSMVAVEVSTKLSQAVGSSELTGTTINLANAYSRSLEKFSNEVNVHDMNISMALDKGDVAKTKELMASRAGFISETQTEFAEKQGSLSSNLKDILANYIRDFHERDITLAQAEIAATVIPGGLALKELKTGGKILSALKTVGVQTLKKGVKHGAEHAAEHFAEHAAKAGGIGLMKYEMRQDAANAASEMLNQSTHVNMTALDFAIECVPVYGSVKLIQHVEHEKDLAGERADKAVGSLFGEAAGPTRVAMKGGHE